MCRLEGILRDADDAANLPREQAEDQLRMQKAELHLLVALADLGGIWSLLEVTCALSRFADAAVRTALWVATEEQIQAGRLLPPPNYAPGPVPGYFLLAMGKHGAYELNYSSDIDLIIFYEPTQLQAAPGIEPSILAARICEGVTEILQRRKPTGYVFRVDLRLRPDPSSTPIAVPVGAAHVYYETLGQNWERAAFIKARVIAGDIGSGVRFISSIRPFIWRKNLDFSAISDIQSIIGQIRSEVDRKRTERGGIDLKLGRGGIREIEFFVQTQQLILGGRHSELRSPRTVDALKSLASLGHISHQIANELCSAYEALRTWEHRAQMIADEQTHHLPLIKEHRQSISALSGYRSLRSFDKAVIKTLNIVSRNADSLFLNQQPPSSRFGSLVFTGPDDDPDTLLTLSRMGFTHPTRISSTIRSWRHGRIAATRSERGRELLTQLTPHLLEAVRKTGAPDVAFNRFSIFFSSINTGIQLQSMFLAHTKLFELIVRVLTFGPSMAQNLARRPATLDSMLDPAFFSPIVVNDGLDAPSNSGGDFEAAMNSARKFFRERSFRIGAQVLAGVAEPGEAGLAFAQLADTLIRYLAMASIAEVERKFGNCSGAVAVVALGKCGSREMTAQSDLDLMTIYRFDQGTGAAKSPALSPETFYTRFTQRLVSALSSPTAEGGLYEVDMQLRPSGTKGPVAVNISSFREYYDRHAETWELLALTRARIVWASSAKFELEAANAIEAALRQGRERGHAAAETREMRALLSKERPSSGFWDMKRVEGGLIDIEFIAQFLQIANAAKAGPLRQNTGEALVAMVHAQLLSKSDFKALIEAWRLQQDVSQLLKVALEHDANADEEPAELKRLLAKAGGAGNYGGLRTKLKGARMAAHKAFDRILADEATDF